MKIKYLTSLSAEEFTHITNMCFLIKKWLSEVMNISSPNQMRSLDVYKQILKKSKINTDQVILLIFHMWNNKNYGLCMPLLLWDILQDGPKIPKEDLGRVKQIKKHWFKWAKQKNMI